MKVLSSVAVGCPLDGDFYVVEATLEDGSTMRVRVYLGETVQDAIDRQLSSN